jgi:RNAse (barnase) inhibitor barstar
MKTILHSPLPDLPDLRSILEELPESSYWFGETLDQAVELRSALASLSNDGVRTACIDLKEMRSEDELFDSFSAYLSFPDYFGRNWAALYDCLFDLSWLPEESVCIAIIGCSTFRKAHPRWFKILRSQLTEVDDVRIEAYLARRLVVVMDRGD